VLLNKNDQITKKNKFDYNIFYFFFIIILIIEFLSIDLNNYSSNLDIFHEGLWLTSSSNSYFSKGLWSSSYIARGLWGNFEPLILWKLFNVDTIGITRLFKLFLLLLNKILLVSLSREISKNLLFDEKTKAFYFIILSILLISLISYEPGALSEFGDRSFLFLLFLLVFSISLYQIDKLSFPLFFLGLFSIISLIWYIDIGAYINTLLLLILIYFLTRSEFKKCACILLGIILGWVIFISIIPQKEFNEFVNHTFSIYTTIDYIHGLIYPTPFLSGDARSTRAILLIILSGIFVIIINFSKHSKLSYYNKIFLLFLFVASLLIFKTGLSRSDSVHIKSSSGFTSFLIYSVGLYFLFNLILNQYKINILISKFKFFFKNKYINLFLIFILLSFVILKGNLINIKNISSTKYEINKLINYEDEQYLSSDYKELIKYYKKLSKEEKCLQILTNETALPYLLKKPTCTQFYLMWTAGPINIQKKFVKQLKDIKPKIILYNSEIEIYKDSFKRIPLVIEYINENYSFHSKFKFWTFVELN